MYVSVYPACGPLRFLDLWFIVFQNFEKSSAIFLFKYFFHFSLSLLSFWDTKYIFFLYFLDALFWFFSTFFFLFVFLFESSLLTYLHLKDFFLSCVQYSNKTLKNLFISGHLGSM